MDLLNLEPDPSRELEKTISFTAGFLLLERALQTRTDAGIIKPGGIGCYYLRNYCLPQIELSLTYEGEAATLASASSSFSSPLLSMAALTVEHLKVLSSPGGRAPKGPLQFTYWVGGAYGRAP